MQIRFSKKLFLKSQSHFNCPAAKTIKFNSKEIIDQIPLNNQKCQFVPEGRGFRSPACDAICPAKELWNLGSPPSLAPHTQTRTSFCCPHKSFSDIFVCASLCSLRCCGFPRVEERNASAKLSKCKSEELAMRSKMSP